MTETIESAVFAMEPNCAGVREVSVRRTANEAAARSLPFLESFQLTPNAIFKSLNTPYG
jgi:hypothetical protein